MSKALALRPAEVIRSVKTARLRGRGGAGFPTGLKWEFTRAADGVGKTVICNADEGEPGTFKDRVILTECPDMLIEGMTIAGDAQAVQLGGAAGQLIGPEDFERTICYDDLSTGGSLMVFGTERNIVEITRQFVDFFRDESCGYCTPCRVGNILMAERLDRILKGRGEPSDLDVLEDLGETMKTASRCGLGQTAPNPVLSNLRNFRGTYENLVQEDEDGFKRSFNMQLSSQEFARLTGRQV